MTKELIRDQTGYYKSVQKPPAEELVSYYAEQYYQSPTGQYQQEYSQQEIKYFENRAIVCMETLRSRGIEPSSLYEVGCGEGFFADYFFRKSLNVTLNDLSSFGLEKFHPHLAPYLYQGDGKEHIRKLSKENKKYDLIVMDHVLQHVIDPVGLLKDARQLMSAQTVLRITVTNNFSGFQQMLLAEGLTTETWVCPPVHLTYFNASNLAAFCQSLGFEILSVQCDFPIELFLTNSHSHYYDDRSLGKSAHQSRVLCTNYMIKKDVRAYINMSEGAAGLEYGRDTIIYLTGA